MEPLGALGVDEPQQQIREVERVIEQANKTTWNAKGLNILSPRDVAFQFVSVHADSFPSREYTLMCCPILLRLFAKQLEIE